MKLIKSQEFILIACIILLMLVYFLLAHPKMNDDGFHYEGFAESLARGKLDFKTFYGFQGLSFFAVPIFWLTHSKISIIITSAIFSLLSLPLAYLIGRDFYESKKSGIYFLILFLLTPYPYTTMMRGFQEAALLFFILLIIYASIRKKIWVPVAWAIGGIVKPFSLVLFPLFIKDFLNKPFSGIQGKKIIWLLVSLVIGGAYLGASFYQTGHLINNAAIGSYSGNFNTGSPPPLIESFNLGIKGFLRVGANMFLSYRKIMISPFVILLGGFSLLLNKSLKLRKEIILAIILNFLLIGSFTFSFSKYLLPMTTLLSLAAVPILIKKNWIMALVFVDSFFVFLPIWRYFGVDFWQNIWAYMLPFYYSVIVFIFYEFVLIKLRKNP